MFRWNYLILIVCFIFWIIPLGAFIKPAQEELACNGQRAICLCSHLLAKTAHTSNQKVFVSPTAHKEVSSFGSSHDFLIPATNSKDQTGLSYLFLISTTPSSLKHLRSIEHVPKT